MNVNESLSLFHLLPLVEWMTLSSTSKSIQGWFEQAELWQKACHISACRGEANQCGNDVSYLRRSELSNIVSKLLRVSLLRTPSQILSSARFPSQSPVHIIQKDDFWLIQRDGLDMGCNLLGSKTWTTCEMMRDVLAQDAQTWPTGFAALAGSAVIELGAGLGLLSLVVSRFCSPARILLTDGEIGCVRMAAANIGINALPVRVETEVLQFGETPADMRGQFDVVVASDVAYSLELVQPLWRSVSELLTKGCGTFIVGHMDRSPSSTARLISCAKRYKFVLKHQHDLWACTGKPKRDLQCPTWVFIFERQT